MRFFHLADLHLGKSVNNFPLLPDQAVILQEVLQLAEEHRPGAVVLAGDIYDRTTPPVEAVRLYDGFLTQLSRLGIPVLAVAGNHDSAERLGFAGRLLQQSAVYNFGPYAGGVPKVTLGGKSPVDFHLLPFVRPSSVRPFFPGETISSYHDAVRLALTTAEIDEGRPNVLVAHQFVTAGGKKPESSDSELSSVGGLDEVDASLFDAFDYVALGHIHGPQRMGREAMRYAGSPLKYSFSERRHEKSISMVEIEGVDVNITALPLHPLRDMREIAGGLDALLSEEVWGNQNREDYLRIVLTDEQEIPDAMARLRRVYPNAMELSYENTRSRTESTLAALPDVEHKTAAELFAQFYEEQNGAAPNEIQNNVLSELLGDKGVAL